MKCVPVTTTKTVNVCGGHWESQQKEVPCGGCGGCGAAAAVRRLWRLRRRGCGRARLLPRLGADERDQGSHLHRPTSGTPKKCRTPTTSASTRHEERTRTVKLCKYKNEERTRTVKVCKYRNEERTRMCNVTKCQPETRTCEYKVCKYVTEQRTKEVQYTVCKPEQRTRTYTVCRYECQPEEKTVTYTVCVPETYTEEVPVKVRQMVCKQIEVPACGGGCGGCGGCGCNCVTAPCWTRLDNFKAGLRKSPAFSLRRVRSDCSTAGGATPA